MPDFSLCAGRRRDDDGAPLKACSDCRRRTTPPGAMQSYIEPPVRRVAGTTRYVCEMRLEPLEVADARA